MGIYLNPGNENFRRITNADIYVDKTMMIEVTNRWIEKGNNYICISRPRRFGKTIAGNMLSAYYSKGCDSRDLFAPFKISAAEGYRGRLLFVGIDYDEQTKTHTCRIETFDR